MFTPENFSLECAAIKLDIKLDSSDLHLFCVYVHDCACVWRAETDAGCLHS